MRMRERTRSNCGRRCPSTSVAKVEGGERPNRQRPWGPSWAGGLLALNDRDHFIHGHAGTGEGRSRHTRRATTFLSHCQLQILIPILFHYIDRLVVVITAFLHFRSLIPILPMHYRYPDILSLWVARFLLFLWLFNLSMTCRYRCRGIHSYKRHYIK